MKKPKRIKSFELFAHEIKVHYMETLPDKEDGGYLPYKKEIHLATHNNGEPIDEMVLLGSLLHELLHAMCDVTNRTKLYKDEQFVEDFGQLFLQFLKTRK